MVNPGQRYLILWRRPQLKQLDVGHLLRAEASYVDLHGTSESVITIDIFDHECERRS